MHYSRHRLTALVIYVTTLTYASTNKLALFARCSVRQKLNRVSSVQFCSVTSFCIYAPLKACGEQNIIMSKFYVLVVVLAVGP